MTTKHPIEHEAPPVITITYVEWDPVEGMIYAEWRRGTLPREWWAYGDETKFNSEEETDETELPSGEVRGIPREVREAMAKLVLQPAAK